MSWGRPALARRDWTGRSLRRPRQDPKEVQAIYCPYDGVQAILSDTSKVYSSGYIERHPVQPIYLCPNYPACDSYVGCHKGTLIPLGRMANKELRKTRSAANQMFDALWKAKMKKDKSSKRAARDAGYEWLAGQLGMDREKCHIGMMDVPECRMVVAVCAPYFKKPGGSGE